VAHEFKSVSRGALFATVDVEGTNLCLSGRGHDGLYDLRNGEDSSVVGKYCTAVQHEEMSPSTTASPCF
jgi:hypothetical protein